MVDPRSKARVGLVGALWALGLLGLAGCPLPLHRPPPKNAPAATVKFRLGHFYKPRPGLFGPPVLFHPTKLKSLLAIDERELVYRPIAGVASTWTRVRPGWRQYRVRSFYIEAYHAMVREYYYETKHTMCHKNVCEYTMGKHKCSYKYVSCTKQERKSRNVQRVRYRTVANCSTIRRIHMRKGVTYLLSYRYVGPRACTLTCHIQQFQAGGGFRLSPCPNVR